MGMQVFHLADMMLFHFLQVVLMLGFMHMVLVFYFERILTQLQAQRHCESSESNEHSTQQTQ